MTTEPMGNKHTAQIVHSPDDGGWYGILLDSKGREVTETEVMESEDAVRDGLKTLAADHEGE